MSATAHSIAAASVSRVPQMNTSQQPANHVQVIARRVLHRQDRAQRVILLTHSVRVDALV